MEGQEFMHCHRAPRSWALEIINVAASMPHACMTSHPFPCTLRASNDPPERLLSGSVVVCMLCDGRHAELAQVASQHASLMHMAPRLLSCGSVRHGMQFCHGQ